MTPVDVYAVVNSMAESMFGAETGLKAKDTSTFVTVGEAMLRQGYENTLNALSLAMGRSIFAVRPYTGKFRIITRTEQEYGAIKRKISYFYDPAEPSQDWNTDITNNQLFDGKSIDHYKIRKRYPLEIHFVGLKVIQKHFTRFRDQLKLAFRNEEEFGRYYYGLLVEVNNELELMRESENRLHVLNHIGAVYNTGSAAMKVNLTEGFNKKFGTAYTSAQLRSEHLKEFLAYMVSVIKYTSRMMTEFNTLYHLTPKKTNDAGEDLVLLRHTPMTDQRLLLLEPLMIDAEALVLPQIFNDQYLKIANYEGVNYWQNPVDPGAVQVTPNQLNVSTGVSETGSAVNIPYVVGMLFDREGVNYWQNPVDPGAVQVTPNQLNVSTGVSETGSAVNIPYVVGMLFDRDALVTSYHMEDVLTTPVNAAGNYYNTYYHWAKDYQDDLTENTVIFYMADPG